MVACRVLKSHPLFLKVLPPPVGTGGTFSFFATAGFLPPAAFAVDAGFLGTGALFAAGFVTMVVPALVLLPSLLRPSGSVAIGAPRLSSWRLGTRETSFEAACRIDALIGLTGRMACAFSKAGAGPALTGERDSVRELWDLGDRTVEVTTVRDAARVAFVFAVAVLARFFA